MATHRVHALLMGGQACVFYGAAEFSRDTDLDWSMIQRLVEADYLHGKTSPSEDQVRFWLNELRTPELLVEVTEKFPGLCQELQGQRALLTAALSRNFEQLRDALAAEEKQEREKDRLYWLPLKAELEQLRHARLK
jgi:hypothetical protein